MGKVSEILDGTRSADDLTLQLTLIDMFGQRVPRPQLISRVLLEFDPSLTIAAADALTLHERRLRLVHAALGFGRWPAWFVARCDSCSTPADVLIEPGDMLPAGQSRLPKASLEVASPSGDLNLRMPDGHAEALLTEIDGVAAAARQLLKLCAADDVTARRIAKLGDEDALIAANGLAAHALDPEHMPGMLSLPCPTCSASVFVRFDGIDWIARHIGAALDEVALLARTYGWSETDICALPEARRRGYLALAEAAS